MASAPKQLFQAALTTTLTTLYTAPASPGYAELLSVVFVNTTASPITVSIYVVPPSGSAGTSNAIAYNWSLDVQGLPYVIKPALVVPAGATIQASASAAGVTATASGLEVT
ncbi:MAG: hypothetical protein IRY83_04135 [Chloroflexi bacterium]|nr:hypothetical protein [Chloroflexota bacterium]